MPFDPSTATAVDDAPKKSKFDPSTAKIDVKPAPESSARRVIQQSKSTVSKPVLKIGGLVYAGENSISKGETSPEEEAFQRLPQEKKDELTAQSFNTPAISLPRPSDDFVKKNPVAGTVLTDLSGMASGLTTAKNLAIMGALGGAGRVVQILVGAGFSREAAKDTTEHVIKAYEATDPEERKREAGHAIASAFATGAMGYGTLHAAANLHADAVPKVGIDAIKNSKDDVLDSALEDKTFPQSWKDQIPIEKARRAAMPETAKVLQTQSTEGGETNENEAKNEGQEKADEKEVGPSTDEEGSTPPLRTAINNPGGEPITGNESLSKHDSFTKKAIASGVNPDTLQRGFVDTQGKFVNRVDAAQIALDNGMIDQATYDRAMARGNSGSYSDFMKANGLPDDAPTRKAYAETAAREDPDKGLHSEDLKGLTIVASPLQQQQKKDDTDASGEKIEANTPESSASGVKPEKEVVARVPQAAPITAQALGISHPMPEFIKNIADFINKYSPTAKLEWPQGKQLANRFKGLVDTVMGKTFPKTTIADKKSGELAARWISARIAAPHQSNVFVTNVLADTGIDPVEFGTALTEDNLRSVKDGFLQEVKDAKTPEEKSNAQLKADAVGTTIGGKNSPFKTEEEYQAFIKDPTTQSAIDRHRSAWQETVDPMYKNAMSIDPDEELPSRGKQTGARVNLSAIQEGDTGGNRVTTVGQGNLLGTLKKKSPFGRQATGAGQYNTNYFDMMANTFGRQAEIAGKNAFEKQLVDSGNAVIDKPGQASKIMLPDEEGVKEFPFKRQTIITKDGAISKNQSIYVRDSLSSEYRTGSNVDASKRLPFVTAFLNVFNRLALAGLTDASVHVTNLAITLMTRPGMMGSAWMDSLLSATGRLDIPVVLTKAIVKAFQDNKSQISELAEIGALRDERATRNPGAKVIQWADRTTRLMLDDAYKNLVKQGLVEDTETNRREFVNQAGQYNKRAQGQVVRFFRDSGFSPFITAGRNFAALGVRTAMMSPGVEAASGAAAAALRANVLSKWIGATVFIGTSNLITTGLMSGRPGTPLGYIDTGKNDANGRPLTFDALTLMGLGRGLRTLGIRGFVNAKNLGLGNKDAAESAWRDIANTAISPFAGPAIRTGMAVLLNQSPAIGVGKPLPVAPPGDSQTISNIKNAAIDTNPLVASIHDAMQPGATWYDGLRRQLPRFTLSPQRPQEMLDKYPEIVRKAQARDFVNDVVGRARKLDPSVRQQFIKDQLQRLSPEDMEQALKVLKYSGLEGKPAASFTIKKPRNPKGTPP